MTEESSDVGIVFGPVPSRRLGRSLGINNIPPKHCTYGCVYCQLGRTTGMILERRRFHGRDRIVDAVRSRVNAAEGSGDRIDYLTFVPDGEPTLDADLGGEIASLSELGIPIAVVTNGSLLWMEDVLSDLLEASWVSVKVDAVDEDVWRRIDRPHGELDPGVVLGGLLRFSEEYGGSLNTETMLVAGVNDVRSSLSSTACFIERLRPRRSYISVPTRPPALDWVKPPGEEVLTMAYSIYQDSGLSPEFLIGYEGSDFSSTGDPAADLLNITSVHPMREDAVGKLLGEAGAGLDLAEEMIRDGRMVVIEYNGERYYMRRLPGR